MSSFIERLLELRLEKKKTHQDMANMLGVTRQAYGHYENKKREPDYETLEKLADYFDVQIDYLVGRTDERKSVSETENRSEESTAANSKMKFFNDLEKELGLDLSDPQVQKMIKRAAKVMFTNEE